eukprot:m.73610 g.73610  ORF g.73610 m.73610 type:complete len:222 (-) comp11776_c1_seq7:1849-2514(-)
MGKKGAKKKGQKHQNAIAFKPGKYGESKQMKLIRESQAKSVCKRCHDILEWKKKYDKYKPRTKPGICRLCERRNVTFAYHVICTECSNEKNICAKCEKKDEEIEKVISQREIEQQEAKEQARLVMMKERERRSYFRKLEREMQEREENEENDNDEKEEKTVKEEKDEKEEDEEDEKEEEDGEEEDEEAEGKSASINENNSSDEDEESEWETVDEDEDDNPF